MVSAKTTVINPMGLHLRPAQVFIKAIAPFASEVDITANGRTVNAKSIMNLMAACIKQGTEIEIQCSGPDEQEALDAALQAIASGLGE